MSDITQTQWTGDAILEFLETNRETLREMGVVKIGLFGSYVRGDQKPESDVDVLLTIENWTWKRWCRLWNYLEDRIGLKIDLVPEEDLRPELRPYVLPEVRYAEIGC